MTAFVAPPRPALVPTSAAQVPSWAAAYRAGDFPPYGYTADLLELTINLERGTLDGLFVERRDEPFAREKAWPGGFVEWVDANARDAGLREVMEETGQEARPRFFETLDTYDDNGRDPRQFAGHYDRDRWISTGARIVSKAFIALFHRPTHLVSPKPGQDTVSAAWENVYTYLPWEDLRHASGRAVRREIIRRLTERWVKTAVSRADMMIRSLRLKSTFGSGSANWNEERTAERFALLMETGLVREAHRNQWGVISASAARHVLANDTPLAFDHRRMLADALGRLRGKMKYTPSVLAALTGDQLTAATLHTTCEAVAGRPIHLGNLRRAFTQTNDLLQLTAAPVGAARNPGRQAVHYRWVMDVELLRLDPSIRMPWAPLPPR
jgi:hypothetical protein